MGTARSAGRPLREPDPTASELVTQLVTEIVQERVKQGKTLRDIAEGSHYSISALSQGTSGCSIPTKGVITAYAKVLEVDPKQWLEMRTAAVEEKRRQRRTGERAAPAVADQPLPWSKTTAVAVAEAVAEAMPHATGSLVRQITQRKRRDGDVLDSRVNAPQGADAESVSQLVREAVEQATPQLHGNRVSNELSLCTVPGDLMDLLRDTYVKSEMGLRDIARLTTRNGVEISSTSLHKLLKSEQLPPAEVLDAILAACRVHPNEIRVWLFHRARLELALQRNAHRATPSAVARINRISYGYRSNLQLLVTAISILAAIVPVLMRL